ncbi:hypothetical protein RM190_04825 [Paracoccus sp. CPCC 101403]|uniref:HTH cro/C1-type domain-containing protein n=1 Tax=Paracoccus broussonetiae TaxID=3075834 RepID=A0ABU3EAD0_9RHOB|nr:hypothetical protein [Paracoccus sp. CPCC 101403]MDT1061172.1 hypothetical protein [Paracoccus sp. CPCC 101403]
MQTPHSRLKEARLRAGYKTATAGATRAAVPYGTYSAHENGHRGFGPEEAAHYGKVFNVRREWLLYGDLGPEPIVETDDPQPPLPPVVKAITENLDGLNEAEQRTIADIVRRQRDLFRPEDK